MAAALITSACAAVGDGITFAGATLDKTTTVRQQADRLKLETSRSAWCGSGLDVHLEATGKNPVHAQAAMILCGAMAPILLRPPPILDGGRALR